MERTKVLTMKLILAFVSMLSITFRLAAQTTDWKETSLVEIHTVNEWCRHCPDWNQTRYSFKLQDGMIYVGETHKRLNVTLNGHTRLHLESDGRIGSTLHILDDSNKEQKLKIVEKKAP